MRTTKFILLLFLTFTGRNTFANNPDTSKIREAYAKLMNQSNCIATISEIQTIADSNLLSILPFYRLYEIKITDGSVVEYNQGKIPAIVAISKVNINDIRFLLPHGFVKDSSDFFEIFYQKPVKNEKTTCKSIANLLMKTYVQTSYNCKRKPGMDKVEIIVNKNVMTVSTLWVESCTDDVDSKKISEIKELKKTIFTFKDGLIVNINVNDWKK